jgi:hypothetical protein
MCSWLKDKSDAFQAIGSIGQLITAVILLLVTSWLICRSNQIASRANDIIADQRQAQIRPILRLSAQRIAYYKKNVEVIVVKVDNIGTGTAKNVGIVIKENTGRYGSCIAHTFYPINTFPIYEMPLKIDGMPSYSCSADPEKEYGQDFILNGASVEFQYGPTPIGTYPMELILTFFISFLDVDKNEYFTVTSLAPGEGNMDVIFDPQRYNTKWLDSLSKDAKLYEHKTIEHTRWRKPGEFFPGTEKINK